MKAGAQLEDRYDRAARFERAARRLRHVTEELEQRALAGAVRAEARHIALLTVDCESVSDGARARRRRDRDLPRLDDLEAARSLECRRDRIGAGFRIEVGHLYETRFCRRR